MKFRLTSVLIFVAFFVFGASFSLVRAQTAQCPGDHQIDLDASCGCARGYQSETNDPLNCVAIPCSDPNATNAPTCDQCNTGYSRPNGADFCVADSCTNNATNPPDCTTCETGYHIPPQGGSCVVDQTSCDANYHLDTGDCVLDACINIPGSTSIPSGYVTGPDPRVTQGFDCYACKNYSDLSYVSGIPSGYFRNSDDGICYLYACSNHDQLAGNPTGVPPTYTKNEDGTCSLVFCTENSDQVVGQDCVIADPGCTNASATNYNPAANQDDGSCSFSPPPNQGGPGDGRSDGKSDGGSSCPSCTASQQSSSSTSTGGQVLGASTDTLAATGVGDQLVNIMLAVTASLVIFLLGHAFMRAHETV